MPVSTRVKPPIGGARLRQNVGGLVAAWPLFAYAPTATGDPSPGQVRDASGHGLHGDLQRFSPSWDYADWVTTQSGPALKFNELGQNSIDHGNVLAFARTDTWSIRFRVTIPTTWTAVGQIIGKEYSSSPFEGYGVQTTAAGKLLVYLLDTSSNLASYTTGATVNDGLEHEVVWTYNGSSSSSGHAVWIDGVQDTGGTASGTVSAGIDTSSSHFMIGANGTAGAPANFTRMTLGLAEVYNRVLSPAAIARLYADPFAHYRVARPVTASIATIASQARGTPPSVVGPTRFAHPALIAHKRRVVAGRAIARGAGGTGSGGAGGGGPTDLTDPWLDPADGLDRPGTPIGVYRLSMGSLQPLPSLVCTSIETREGPFPGAARFRYKFDGQDAQSPQSIEEALGTQFTGSEVINPGDELVVYAQEPSGLSVPIFDGFATDFGGSLGSELEQATIGAVGVAWRTSDLVIPGVYMRQGPDWTVVADTLTDIRAVFNPRGMSNATPANADHNWAGGKTSPAFVEPLDQRLTNGSRFWTLPMAARFIVYGMNANETFVKCPQDGAFDILYAREPVSGQSFDPGNPATYTNSPIYPNDKPITGRTWSDLLWEMVHDKGFSYAWRLSSNSSGLPQTALDLYVQQTQPLKQLNLSYGPLDPATSNLQGAGFHRETAALINSWLVDGHLVQYEASFVLACGFPSQSSDASSLDTYSKNDPSFATNSDKYRLYVFDESGDGHYAPGSTTQVATIPSLDSVFGAPVMGVPQYVTGRRRVPQGNLITLDGTGKPRKWTVHISTNYAGSSPGVWDGTGQWQEMSTGSVRLLSDRLGIYLDMPNPNSWTVARSANSSDPEPSGVVEGVEAQAAGGSNKFYVMLTCVVEADQNVFGVSNTTAMSPLPQTIQREVDASDRYFKQVIHYKSLYNQSGGGADIVQRDDSPLCLAEATALQYSTQSGVLEGEFEIPRFTAFYNLGDRIQGIVGRGLSFRTDGGAAANSPIYPVVVGVRWELEPHQRTILTLSDVEKGRRPYERVPKPPAAKHLTAKERHRARTPNPHHIQAGLEAHERARARLGGADYDGPLAHMAYGGPQGGAPAPL
jgi:hypothetical protein